MYLKSTYYYGCKRILVSKFKLSQRFEKINFFKCKITFFKSRHGLHPGYYLAMITTSPCIFAEHLMEKEFKNRFLSPKYHKTYDKCMNVFFRGRQFDFMSVGMIYLTYDATMRYWRSIYFIGHIQCALLILFPMLLKLVPKNDRKIKQT